MATNRTDISNKFNNGMIPSEGDFDEIFDNFVHKDEDKANLQMVEAGIDELHYVTPALLRTGLQNLGIITGNCYMPYKEHIDNFSDTIIRLNEFPIPNSVKVFKNGQLLLEGPETGDYYDYTVNYNTAEIIFSDPVSNRNIEIDYWYKNLGPIPGGTDITNLGSSPLEKKDEGNGEGIIIRDRNAANYGNIGLNAVDLSYSGNTSSDFGATGQLSFAVGENVIASGYSSSATGIETQATEVASHAEGSGTLASAFASHAEGSDTEANGTSSHAEGFVTTADGIASHTEGSRTYAAGDYSHAEGYNSDAIGKYSHAGGQENTANSYAETSIGYFGTQNFTDSSTSIVATDRLFNIGNGASDVSRSNALTVLKNGLATLPSVTNALITAASGKAIVTKEYLEANSSATPDATTTVKGKLKLVGDLGGTADLPTTPTAVHITGNENIQGIKTIQTRLDFGIVGSSITGLQIGSGFNLGQAFTKLYFNKDAQTVAGFSTEENVLTANLGDITIKSSGYGFASFSTSKIALGQTRVFNLPATSGTLALENDNKQKVITYPADFTGANYTLTNTDNNFLIFIDNGANNVQITVPTGLPDNFFAAFIQTGAGDVTFIQSGTTLNTPVGLKIKGQNYQVALDKYGSSNNFYLTGNTKV